MIPKSILLKLKRAMKMNIDKSPTTIQTIRKRKCTFWKLNNKSLWLVRFVFPILVPGELDPLSFEKLYVDMHVNKTKFERICSLEY